MSGCPLFLSCGNEREASWLETSTIKKQNIVWLEQTTCSFPSANPSLPSDDEYSLSSAVIFFCWLWRVFLAAGPDIDKAGTGFSALYNVAIAQWCVRNALCHCGYRYPTSGFDTQGDRGLRVNSEAREVCVCVCP